jgi:hypothetical protein
MRTIVKGTSLTDKIITVFELKDNGVVKCYNINDKYFEITAEQKAQHRKQPRSCPYVFIKSSDRGDLKYLSIRKQCKKINEEAIKLKNLTDGKINLFRTGNSPKTALQLFYDLCSPPIPDKIESYEVDILESCRGPIIWAELYEGIAFKYDICSEYPSLMASSQHKYPIGKGELKTFTNEEFEQLKFFSFGIYHVKVTVTNNKVFKVNNENWYTHSDLNYAKTKLKLKMKLIEDGEPNALLYDSTKLITGKKLFGPFVDYLFNLKKAGHREVKQILNALWGALVQSNVLTINTDKIRAGKEILTITPNDNGTLMFDTVIREKFYELDFARIKPFMLSYGRLKISNIILTNLDKVVRVHTDGIICTSEITNIKFGNDLGDLKFESKGNCKIFNCNKYNWKEI